MQEMQVRFLGQEDPLEEGMAAFPSILVWRIPWTEEIGRPQSVGSQRVRHNWSDLAWTHIYVCDIYTHIWGFLHGSEGKECLQCRRPGFEPWVGKIPWRRKWQPTLGTLAWKIPWTEKPGRLQSMGLQRVGPDWATSLSLSYIHICIF